MENIIIYIIPIIILELLLAIIAIVKLFGKQEFKYLNKWIWLAIILFIQIFGPIAFLIIESRD